MIVGRRFRSACPGLVLSANLCAWGLITVAFKLMGAIDWPWWLVLTPFWIPLAIMLWLFLFGVAIQVAIWLSIRPHR